MEKDNKNVNLSLQVIPINEKEAYSIIDESIKVIKESGVKHEVQPFSTIMEGNIDQLLGVVLEAKEAALQAGAEELILNIQIHLKKSKSVSFEEKTKAFR